MQKKILVCFGTRPEAIKMSLLVRSLKYSGFKVVVCVTAQHRKMLDQVCNFFVIDPEYDLNVMQTDQQLNELCSRIFVKINRVLEVEKPDLVLVQGDTTTSAVCAWAAFNRKIKIGHVEAGLRTYNKYMPFPEELNRQITTRIADFHFAPTSLAKKNLQNEEIRKENIIVTGNTVIDSLFWTIDKLDNGYSNQEIRDLKSNLDPSKKLILVTGHRRENFGKGIVNICKAIIRIAKNSDVEIVYPVHLNPNVRIPVRRLLSKHKNIRLVHPLSYPAFIWLLMKGYLIITDSGGIQEEASALGKPILILRETTERPEVIKNGNAQLVGVSCNAISRMALTLLNNISIYKRMSKQCNFYGDGKANRRIVAFLKQRL